VGRDLQNIEGGGVMSTWNKSSGICFAADVESLGLANKIIDDIEEYIDCIKVNYPLVLREGIGAITALKKRYGLPVIADLKVADVEVTNKKIVSCAGEVGADAVFIHGFIGELALAAAKEEADRWGMGMVLITQLTNGGGEQFGQEFSDDFAQIAAQQNFFGIQAPGTRPETVARMRGIVGDELMIFSCGVGAQGGEIGNAIKNGANYEIIGRAIYADKEPKMAASRIAKKIRTILGEKASERG
jgi:orotidine-5'-phosphate decarboxylase